LSLRDENGKEEMKRLAIGLALIVSVAACDNPTEPGGRRKTLAATPTPKPYATTGRVFDVLTQAGFAAVSISGSDVTASSTASGQFDLGSQFDYPGPRVFTFTGSAIVTRVANLRIPGPDAQVSLIAKTFDLTAYDQMLRSPVLRRWVQAPPLVVETRTLQFTDVNASVAVGTSDAMSDAEYQSLTADLGWALPQISGSTFAGFASVVRQSSPAGAVVPILNTGQITVARVTGLTAATGFLGLRTVADRRRHRCVGQPGARSRLRTRHQSIPSIAADARTWSRDGL
jgi:hypothetical protein